MTLIRAVAEDRDRQSRLMHRQRAIGGIEISDFAHRGNEKNGAGHG